MGGGLCGDGTGQGRQRGEADRTSDLAGGVHQAAGQPRVLRGDAFHGERGELDEGDAQPQTDQDARTQDVRDVAPVGADPGQPQQARGLGEQGRGQGRGGADAPGDAGRQGRAEHVGRGERELAGCGDQGIRPEDLLLVQRQEEEQRDPHGPQQCHQQIARGDPAGGEQARRYQCVRAAQLDHGEGHEQSGGADERTQHPRVRPAGPACRGQSPDQAGEGDGDDGGAQQVEPLVHPAGRPRDEQHHGDQDQGRSERHGMEDPGPAPRLGQDAAQQDTARPSRTGDRAPHPQHPAPPGSGREQVHRQGERGRGDGRGTEALNGTRRDQHARGGGQPRCQRGHGEQRESECQHPTAPHEIGRPAARQEQRPERQAVGVDHPGGAAVRQAHPGADLRKRHVHDRRGEHDRELGCGERRERGSRPRCGGRRGRPGVGEVHGAQTRAARCPLSRPKTGRDCPALSAPVHRPRAAAPSAGSGPSPGRARVRATAPRGDRAVPAATGPRTAGRTPGAGGAGRCRTEGRDGGPRPPAWAHRRSTPR